MRLFLLARCECAKAHASSRMHALYVALFRLLNTSVQLSIRSRALSRSSVLFTVWRGTLHRVQTPSFAVFYTTQLRCISRPT